MPAPKTALGTLANLLVACLLAGALYVVPRTAEAGCRLYQEPNYGGAAYTLGSLDRLRMTPAETSACTGPECGRVVYEASWNNRISSFKVSEGCTLTLWRAGDEKHAHLRATRSALAMGRTWDNAASEALCQCH